MSKEYNCKVLSYPNGAQHITYFDSSIGYDLPDWKKPKHLGKAEKNPDRTDEEKEHCLSTSISRTKNNIYKIARANKWDWFITLTFDRTRTDSSEYDSVISRLEIFLSNLRQRKCPDLKYMIVPELHADGEHYHFHGVLANCGGLRFRYSGHDDYKSGKPIYNIVDWSWGFTTASVVEDNDKVAHYICKYITKDNVNLLAERKRYYASRNVLRPVEDRLCVHPYDLSGYLKDRVTYAKSLDVPVAHQHVTYYELKSRFDNKS